MKKTWWIVIAAAILVIAVAGYFISNQGSKTAPNNAANTSPSQASASQQSQASSTSVQPGVNPKITIAEYSFIPNTVTIKKGDTVKWVNAGSFPHSVTSDSGVELTSSSIQPNGGFYEHLFLKSGTYTYHCSIHPSMKGTVIVVE